MANGSIAGIEPRRTELNNATARPQAAQEGAEPAASAGAAKGSDPKSRDPLRELIDKLERTQALVARVDPALASVIRSVAERADVPGRLEDPVFRTRVAYVTQDVEKLVGPIVGMQQGLRAEMASLAATSPGLRNERMQELVGSTPTIDDRTLVRDIRRGASEIARMSDQASADVLSKVEVLEHRVRLSSRTPVADGSPVRAVAPGQAGPTNVENAGTRGDAPGTTSAPATAQKAEPAPKQAEALSAAAFRRDGQPSASQQDVQQPLVADHGQPARRAGATFAIMAALRKPEATTAAPWDQNLTPLGGRLSKYMDTAQSNRDEAAFTAAERSGQVAVQALQAFANGPGSSIMSKISAASKADPDGMAGVVAGMREGGAYADLRRSFNADLAREKGLAAAVDRTAVAVGQYGRDRAAADGVAGNRGMADAVIARFGKLDAEIGKAASETPHRRDGRSQMEELGEKAAELASKALDAVKAAFKRTPGPEHRPSEPSAAM